MFYYIISKLTKARYILRAVYVTYIYIYNIQVEISK